MVGCGPEDGDKPPGRRKATNMLRDTSTLAQGLEKTNLQLIEIALDESFAVINRLEQAGFPVSVPNLLPFGCHDNGNAERLVAVFRPYLRYCHDFKKWLVYDGRRWLVDATEQAKAAATYVMAMFLLQADRSGNRSLEDYARRSLDNRSINNMLALTSPKIYVQASQLDQDPYLLNCMNGTLDLSYQSKKFILRPHDPHDYITKLVHHNYDPDARCELFARFVDRIMGGGSKATDVSRASANRMVPYLQRALGSALTGIVTDKAVFCFFGQGDNGKTTLLEAVRYVLKEYSAQILVGTLITHAQQDSNAALADLAALRGTRFATTSETEEGQRLAEAKLKYLTSIGEIKTCRKYENHISFPPTHKLFVDGNYRPVVRGGDAIWDRLRLIPFTVRIPKTEIDRELGEKLKREAEGILLWLVKGCEDWHWYRLTNPPEVNDAMKEWRKEDDPISGFIEQCCELAPERPDLFTKSADLWEAYLAWTEREKEHHPLTRVAFGERLTHLSCWPCHHRYAGSDPTRSWGGIALKSQKAVSNEP